MADLPRPGGNITGFINVESSLAGKWIEVLKDIVPRANRAARRSASRYRNLSCYARTK
jgi:putative ABC transport system substrate-binding protein